MIHVRAAHAFPPTHAVYTPPAYTPQVYTPRAKRSRSSPFRPSADIPAFGRYSGLRPAAFGAGRLWRQPRFARHRASRGGLSPAGRNYARSLIATCLLVPDTPFRGKAAQVRQARQARRARQARVGRANQSRQTGQTGARQACQARQMAHNAKRPFGTL